MFTCRGLRHDDIRFYNYFSIPEPAGGENFPIDSPNFTNTVSTIMVLTVIAPGSTQAFRLGGSDIGLLCAGSLESGKRGTAQLRKVAKKVIETVEEALPTMEGEEQEYFQLLLENARQEGLNMPVLGPIPLD